MSAKDWKLGASSCSTKNIDEETFKAYAEAGIDLMEISLSYEKCKNIDWAKTKQLSKDYGVGIWSFHLPFMPFDFINIAAADASIRKSTVEMECEFIKRFSDIGIKIGVIHPSGEPNEEGMRKELMGYAKESLAILAETAASCGSTIAVEDLPRTCLGNCSADIKDLLTADDRLRVCFDTNHLLIEKNSDFIKAVGDKIITVHVSDYDFVDERHWMPFEGKNDWVEIVTLLEEVGYSGPFMYEVGLNTPKSIDRRQLTLADFRENYLACINKQPAAPIGKPLI